MDMTAIGLSLIRIRLARKPEVQRALSLLEKYGYSDFADYTREWDW